MEMTTAERMKGLTMKKKIDRVPMNPFASTYTALISNHTAREYYLNPEIALKCHMNSMMLHKYDAGPGYGVPNWQTWDFGGELEFSLTNRAALPKVIRYPIENIKDTLKIELPDIRTAPISSRMIKFSELSLEKGFGYGVPAGSALTGVEGLIGAQQLLKLMVKDPNHIHYLMRISTDYILSIAKYMIDKFGAEKASAFTAYPLEAHELIPSKYFEKFSLPYTKEIVETLSNWGVNKIIVHLCGNHTDNLDYWINDINVPKRTVFAVGTEMNIVKTAERLGDDYIIAGNVRNSILNNGTPDDVYKESKSIIEKLKDFPGGFILMPDCGLSPLTPSCNVDAMLRAVKDFGRYE
ncbi:uroporphyrinogen decarboxylase HemE [Gottschalkia acidurici 9a]|uniref:Uroporphyrinogen decarboxylase HemE n=1 Tax=Gottschalkia acidurici (strain ATCC 7906 / DSM 604 / BCRC 14475 / CIP 104303 / KCTC 5404 / NCIMB 10678 / 9a) TaxID=1128398 RepID=K0B0J4_GOTA9|nr:uroporphyrinogen decarboxylase family protein [Gottschalkia acidurici]AFS78166.1 uroporphyrinogen decarboxylase HemE [Gottschalkia acidurici 9a]